MLDFLLDIVFPKRCVSCGKWGKFICDQCLSKIEPFDIQVCPYCERPSPYGLTHPRCAKTHGLDGMFVLAHYGGPIKKAIHEIKYRGTYGVLSELVGQLVSRYDNKFDFRYFIPIPLHYERERERGFNQAEEIATQISLRIQSKSKKMPVILLLKRTRSTKPQFDLKYEERKDNVRDAFEVHSRNGFTVHGKNFCLVDDVATTGATIFECAKVLKKSGAEKVWAICVARGG